MPSRTRRAALVASRGWSIGISYDDHVATEARPRDGRRSDPDRLPHENDGRPTGSWVLEDDEELGEPGGNPQLRAEVGVLVGQHEFASPAQPFVEIPHDLLAADNEDHASGSRGVGPNLVTRVRDDDERPVVRDRLHAAQHHVWRGDELADLAPLGGAVHRHVAWPQGVVAAGGEQIGREPDLLERPRRAPVDFGAVRDHREDPGPVSYT